MSDASRYWSMQACAERFLETPYRVLGRSASSVRRHVHAELCWWNSTLDGEGLRQVRPPRFRPMDLAICEAFMAGVLSHIGPMMIDRTVLRAAAARHLFQRAAFDQLRALPPSAKDRRQQRPDRGEASKQR